MKDTSYKNKKHEVPSDEKCFSDIEKKLQSCEANTSTWSSNQDKFHRLRMRIKKTKTFPFVGCCFSKDTDVLTDSGWKPVSSISTQDKVYSMNPENSKASYEAVTKLWEFPAEKLLSIKSNSLNFMVTPNHKMLVSSQWNTKLKFVDADQLNTGHKIPLTSNWSGKSPEYLYGFDSIDFCKFLGWYISEGFTYESGTIGICQSLSNQNKRDMIEELLVRMGLEFSTNETSFLVSCKSMSRELRDMLISLGKSHEKYVPRHILDLGSECLKAVMETMICGDGSVGVSYNGNLRYTYYTSSEQLADDVQEIAQKVGLRARISVRNRIGSLVGVGYGINEGVIRHLSYEVHLLNRTKAKVSRATITEVDYNDNVFCPETEPFHTLYVRRDGIAGWAGNSNIRMPTGETKIRKIKAALINIIFGIRPIVQAIPTPSGSPQVARKIEKFLDHLLMNVAKIKPKSVIAVDQELEKGFYLIKPYYRVETTTRLETFKLSDMEVDDLIEFFDPDKNEEALVQLLAQETEADMSDRVREDNYAELAKAVSEALSGEEEISIKLKDVLYDAPDIEIISPEDFYAPTDGGFDVQKLEYCGHVMFKPLHEIKQNAIGKGWDMAAINEIEAFKDAKIKLSEQTKNMREGIERLNNPSSLVKIVEWYAWYDLNGDGEPEKCVFTLAPEFKKILRKISLPLNNGKWPFVKLYYELTDDRWFSHRGLIELCEDIIKEIDIQHMQKIDQQTIRNTPMFVYRAGMVNPNLVQFIPNQGIPIHGMGDLRNTIDILNNNNPNVEFSYEKEEQILLGRLEEMLGRVDYNLQSQINKREPRTFGEVSLQQQSQQETFGLDASLHIEAFSEVFSMMWDLWCQYGPDEYEFEYFQQRWEKLKLTREESQGKYRICVRGNDQNTNPQVKLQKAQTVLLGATNEMAINMGIVTPQHLANAYRLFYETLEIENAEEYYNPTPQPPPPPDRLNEQVKIPFEELADGEKAQVLSQMGIQPDIMGRQLMNRGEQLEKQAEYDLQRREVDAKERQAKKPAAPAKRT